MRTDHYVMSSYSHTDRRQLWRVESRPFTTREKADDWMEFLQSEEPKKDFFVISRQLPT